MPTSEITPEHLIEFRRKIEADASAMRRAKTIASMLPIKIEGFFKGNPENEIAELFNIAKEARAYLDQKSVEFSTLANPDIPLDDQLRICSAILVHRAAVPSLLYVREKKASARKTMDSLALNSGADVDRVLHLVPEEAITRMMVQVAIKAAKSADVIASQESNVRPYTKADAKTQLSLIDIADESLDCGIGELSKIAELMVTKPDSRKRLERINDPARIALPVSERIQEFLVKRRNVAKNQPEASNLEQGPAGQGLDAVSQGSDAISALPPVASPDSSIGH